MRAAAAARGLLLAGTILLSGCATRMPELEPVEHVDLDRFMGQWYVIANIPTLLEKGAHNAVEIYERNPDGTVATTFRFRDGCYDCEVETYTPTGFVTDHPSNAIWGMRFIWPFRADYRIVYLTDDYSQTVIGRNKRDYVWIMARTPVIPDADYREIVRRIGEMGYDTSAVSKVPQQW